jgi:hypothetical protein
MSARAGGLFTSIHAPPLIRADGRILLLTCSPAKGIVLAMTEDSRFGLSPELLGGGIVPAPVPCARGAHTHCVQRRPHVDAPGDQQFAGDPA